jgi:hypothetical protein
VVLTRSSGVVRLYVDGTSAATASGAVETGTAAATVTLGKGVGGTFLGGGDLDEAGVHATALTAQSIPAHHVAR